MAEITKKLIHFEKKTSFNACQLSANANNNAWVNPTSNASETLNSTKTQIRYQSIVFIKETQEIWTHGKLYKCTSYTLPIASPSTLGGVKLQSNIKMLTEAINAQTEGFTGKVYPVQFDANGKLVVSVPWTDTNTVYSPATSNMYGTVRLGSDTVQTVAVNNPSSTASRTYPVQVNNTGNMVVNVPWTAGSSIPSLVTNLVNNKFVSGSAYATCKVAPANLSVNDTLTITGTLNNEAGILIRYSTDYYFAHRCVSASNVYYRLDVVENDTIMRNIVLKLASNVLTVVQIY